LDYIFNTWFISIKHNKNKINMLKILKDLKRKKVAVIGFGKSGQSAAKLLLKKGAQVIIFDVKPKNNLPSTIVKELEKKGAIFELGEKAQKNLFDVDFIVISPGIPMDVYKVYIKKDIPVISELELAWNFIENKENIIAITGTNGKTTTTAMVSELLVLSGYKVFTGGNYGIPLSELVYCNAKVDKIVLEVSSFQLETIKTFSPKTALLLNITPDHLERYSSEEEYAYYKYKIFENQKSSDFSILPYKEKWYEKFKSLIKGKKLFFGEKIESEVYAYLKNEKSFVIKINEEKEEYSFLGFKLLGIHNRINYMVASLCARLNGATKDSIKALVKNFVGFPHRLEYLGNFGGIYFINDSKATNIDATLQALRSLSGPIILIMGGKHKGSSYKPLIPYIKEKVKILILMGEARFIISEELKDVTETYIVEDLSSAIFLTFKIAQPGDTVLFSPACSSFDQFEDYKERGEVFRKLVFKYAGLFHKEKEREIYH